MVSYALLLSFEPCCHFCDSAASAFFALPAAFFVFSPLPLGAMVNLLRCVHKRSAVKDGIYSITESWFEGCEDGSSFTGS
jgi:hypothetical protein